MPRRPQPDPVPEDSDIYVTTTGPLGAWHVAYCEGRAIAHERHGNLDAQIRAWMDRQRFWPNLWQVSDHGNIHPYSLEPT
jgi:hypothetical protein